MVIHGIMKKEINQYYVIFVTTPYMIILINAIPVFKKDIQDIMAKFN